MSTEMTKQTILVPERSAFPSELEWLRAKQEMWGYWQADAMERMADDERVIAELRTQRDDLVRRLSSVRGHLMNADSDLMGVTPFEPVPDTVKPKRKR